MLTALQTPFFEFYILLRKAKEGLQMLLQLPGLVFVYVVKEALGEERIMPFFWFWKLN